MRAFYQTEWHGIPFCNFCKTSANTPASPSFYSAFYRAFFDKYDGYDKLDINWRRNKDAVADWLASTIPDNARVLSVGCGLGYVENRLWSKRGDHIELHAQDPSPEALQWLKEVMPASRIHESLQNQKESFDFIYLSAVDYAMRDSELVRLLTELSGYLRQGGNLLMISASFLEESLQRAAVRSTKDAIKWLLERFCLYDRGQFWGWMRTRNEYQNVMSESGLVFLKDGFIETPNQAIYWIKGKFP